MFKDTTKVLKTVGGGLQEYRVLVVGDLMLDRYLWGSVDRISPEAPVPVVRVDHASHAAGGAANVAANLSGLGCGVSVAGLVGEDDDGRQLLRILQALGIDTAGVFSIPNCPTITKTRVLGGRQQMLRLDVDHGGGDSSDVREHLLTDIEARISQSAAIILSDYGKGLLDEPLCQAIIRRARRLAIPVFVDPKGLNYEKYRRANLISPNRMELAAVISTEGGDLESLLSEGQSLRSRLSIDHLMVTLGESGIALLDATGAHRFPALAREVFDVSGAGDTVIATTAAVTAAGLDLHDAIQVANLAAGIVIRKTGTAPISKDELVAALAADGETNQAGKICAFESLVERAIRWRLAGQRVVFTNGCFDLFHVGHLALLEQAKREGDCLIVAVNTDKSVRRLKGSGRPIISEDARVRLLAALPCVDAVVLFDEETPLSLIESVRPDVLVKGGDYAEEQVVGAREMKSWGGKVTLIPLVDGSSTTAILKRAVATFSELPRLPVQ